MHSIRMSIPVKLAVFFAFVFLIITYISIQIKYNNLAAQQDELNARIETVNDSIEALQNRLDTPFDKEYVISLAKSKLGYCLPDEIIFYNDLIN